MDFQYRCIDSSGKQITGSVSAEGQSEAKTILRGRGLVPIEIKEVSHVKKRLFVSKRIRDAELYSLFRELSILIKSGIKIDRGFEILLNSTSNPVLKERLSAIARDVKAGKGLAQSFEDAGGFSSLSITMIRAGESVGDLRSAFENIAEYQRFQMQFKGEIKNALAYPSFLIFASLITMFVIFKFIIPRFFSIFGQNEASLPLMARLLYSAGNLFNLTNIYVLVALVIIAIVIFRVYDKKRLFSALYSKITYIPMLGSLVMYLELSRFAYSMYSMLQSGIEFIKALRLSADVIMDNRLRGAIEPAIVQIKEGKGIADVFSQISLLPEMVHNMIRVGEESGNLKEIFYEIHKVFDEKFKNVTKRTLSLVEPIVITITGIIVGLIVISLIMTVMSAGNIKL